MIHVSLYNPFPENTGKTFTVSKDDQVLSYTVEDGLFRIEIESTPNSNAVIAFDFTSFAAQHNQEDSRILSVVLSDIFAD